MISSVFSHFVANLHVIVLLLTSGWHSMGMDMRICSIDCLVKEVWFQMSNNCIY